MTSYPQLLRSGKNLLILTYIISMLASCQSTPKELNLEVDGDYCNNLGLFNLRENKPDKAAFYFRKALGFEHKVEYVVNLGSALLGQKKYEETVLLLMAERKDPQFLNYSRQDRLYFVIGLALEKQRKFPQARNFYKLAYERNNKLKEASQRLAKLEKF